MSFGFGVGDFIAAIELVNKIRKEFVNAPTQFKAISDDVRSLSIVLQDTDVAFPERELDQRMKRDLESIDKGCKNVLYDLQVILDKYSELGSKNIIVGRRIQRVWKRLKWDAYEIKELRSRINTNIGLLSAFNGRLTRDNLVKLVRHQEYQERQTMLDWLTPINYNSQQSHFISQRQEGTGQWLLDSAEFQTWLTDKQTLFCPGIPGAGKTILTAVVIDELTTRFSKDPTVAIAYIYCNYRRQDEQKLDDLLASLLKQLAECQPSLPSSVKELHDRFKTQRTRPSLDEISKSLEAVVTTYSRVFIIVDALDECQVSDGCRSRFLSTIFSLQARTGAKAKFITTSRPIPDIEKEFKGHISREILASDEDVQRYLHSHMSQLPTFILSRPKLQEEIKTKITKAVEGMFLLAQLYLSSLEDKTTTRAINEALQHFQRQTHGSSESSKIEVLSLAYMQAMERINGQKEGFRLLANKVLSWIICAKRPLTTIELQHAIAVEEGDSEIDEDNFPQVEDMITVCAGLVTVDEESNILRLVHYTTQEFFERTQQSWFPDAETDITRVCITYLLFDTFNSGSCSQATGFYKRLHESAFYGYAARNWGYHARKASTAVRELILQLFNKDSNLSACTQALLGLKQFSTVLSYTQRYPRQLVGVHFAAFFGLEEIMTTLGKDGHHLNAKDTFGRTPLWWAADRGHKSIIELLLETDTVDADVKDISGCTPLSRAAAGGHETVVELLLHTGKVDADWKDRYAWTPLWHATVGGHEAVVKLLLSTDKVDADFKDKYGQTPLWWASKRGLTLIVKLLLDTEKVDVNSKDISGWTPLSCASSRGYTATAKLLLDSKVDTNFKDKHGWTPLSRAADNGHETTVKLLLGTGKFDPESKDAFGWTPLSRAAASGHDAVVKLLLDLGKADPYSKDIFNRTPISRAAENGRMDIVQLLENSESHGTSSPSLSGWTDPLT